MGKKFRSFASRPGDGRIRSFMENAWVVSGDEVRASSVVPCNLIQARQYANTDGHRPDANLILAGFQLQKCQGISRLKRIVILSSVVISVMQRHVNYARIHNNTAYIPPRCNSRYGRARNTPKSCNDRVPIPPKSFPFSLSLSLSPFHYALTSISSRS